MNLQDRLTEAAEAIDEWEGTWGPYESHPASQVDAHRFEEAWSSYLDRLGGNYPFFHPRYAGQMLKPPHPVAVAGYLAAMQINPNNHALDGGPPTGRMEKEVVEKLVGMLGFPDASIGHLTGGGTVANLEALWVARTLHPEKKIAVSEEAHYTHRRAADLLDLDLVSIPADRTGALDTDVLAERLEEEPIGTVVVTAGTTGRGRVDPIAEVVELAADADVRVHADAAYGGFFALLARAGSDLVPEEDLRALARCDSLVVDPHKHGLQPYGCGCVLFADPAVGRVYQHDSPYTYFTSDELHLGEISLECSRPGAAAGALWLTLETLPLRAEEGLGPILEAGLRAARSWAGRIRASDRFALYGAPDLDILVFYPIPDPEAPRGASGSEAVDRLSQTVFERGMEADRDPIYLSVLREPADRWAEVTGRRAGEDGSSGSEASRGSDGVGGERGEESGGRGEVRLLRSVLMKPGHERYVERLHRRLEALHPASSS